MCTTVHKFGVDKIFKYFWKKQINVSLLNKSNNYYFIFFKSYWPHIFNSCVFTLYIVWYFTLHAKHINKGMCFVLIVINKDSLWFYSLSTFWVCHHRVATSRWNSNTVSCDSMVVPSSGHGSKTVLSIPKRAGCPEQQGQQADQARRTWGWLSEVHRICYLSAQGRGRPRNEGDHERSDQTVVHRVPVSGISCQCLHTTMNHPKII